jgi:peptide chain release factor 2
MTPEEITKRLEQIETEMAHPDFWADKDKAQAIIREMKELQDKKDGLGVYDRGGCIVTILSGAGGDDAEDFSRMLFDMYEKFCAKHALSVSILERNENTQNGYRNISFEVAGKNAYKPLKGESGVHRLVRLSPFNSKNLRQTSFSLVEVLPKIEKAQMPELREDDVKIEFSKAGGPGGQNVNKRESAVRLTHIPTGITVAVREERSQEQNKERALEILRGKLYQKAESEHKSLAESMRSTKNTEIEWGSQIRSYVLHPYKMVKDHRSGIETSNAEAVLDGGIEIFGIGGNV